jgi:hypothetical protein
LQLGAVGPAIKLFDHYPMAWSLRLGRIPLVAKLARQLHFVRHDISPIHSKDATNRIARQQHKLLFLL